MTEWYYSTGGKQNGPVNFEQLQALSRSGGLDPKSDMVWTSTMKDWLPAGQVDGLFQQAAVPSGVPAPTVAPTNPYSPPLSSWNEVATITAGESLDEIISGSEFLDVGACVKRGFELAKRNAVTILLVGLVYFGITFGVGIVTSIIETIANAAGSSGASPYEARSTSPGPLFFVVTLVSLIIKQVVSGFLSLGTTRIALNLVSGKPADIGQLFGEGSKLLRAIGASIIFGAMLVIGLLLLIVPGIYVALRYGQYLHAIVDRDLGVFEAFSYSSKLTTNNRMRLFLLGLLSMLIMFAGVLACGVGVFVALPVVWLANFVAYRWMQYGYRAALDYEGTTVPMLSKLQ